MPGIAQLLPEPVAVLIEVGVTQHQRCAFVEVVVDDRTCNCGLQYILRPYSFG